MQIQQLSVEDNPEYAGHEQVCMATDKASGLQAIIALHSTALGPAAGGCRRWHYAGEAAAVTDALRLSRGMSYKNAMANLPLGGGKAVIMVKPDQQPTAEEFVAFGNFVQSLQGRYITAEDVGVSSADMQQVRRVTAFVSGLPQQQGTVGGDPSPSTALGVFLSIQRMASAGRGQGNLAGMTVAVQGVGHVGYHLCRLLHGAGAKLKVADINQAQAQRVAAEFDAQVLRPDAIVGAEADVFAPCALGGVINHRSIDELRVAMVAGAANNQLATPADGDRLMQRGITLLPDYVINAGGIIAVAAEYLGGVTPAQLAEQIGQIPDRLERLMDEAAAEGVAPGLVADRTATDLISKAALRMSPRVA